MIRFQVLEADDEGTRYIGMAKAKARALIEAGERTFTKNWMIAGVTVRARAIEFGADVVVKLNLTGGLTFFNRLFNWPSAVGAFNFVLRDEPKAAPGKPAPVVPTSQRIFAVPADVMTPLNHALGFRALNTHLGEPYTFYTPSKIFRDFQMLARHQRWLLRQWMETCIHTVFVDRLPGDPGELASPPTRPVLPTDQVELIKYLVSLTPAEFIAVNAALAYWQIQLPLTFNDCLISDPVITPEHKLSDGTVVPESIEAYFLLGAFRNNAALTDGQGRQFQEFRGVVLPYSTLKALTPTKAVGISINLSSFADASTFTGVRVLVTGVGAEYQRLKPGVFQFIEGTGVITNFLSQLSYTQITSSPFSVTYDHFENIIVKGKNPGTAPFDDAQHVFHVYEQHRLTATGSIVVDEMDVESFAGTITYGFAGDIDGGDTMISAVVPRPMPTTFFSGDELVPVGDFDFSGSEVHIHGGLGSGVDGVLTWRSSVPFIAPGSKFAYVDEYFSEYAMVRSGFEIVTDFEARDHTFVEVKQSSTVQASLIINGPRVDDETTTVWAGGVRDIRTDTELVVGLSMTNGDGFGAPGMTPRASGLPILTVNSALSGFGGGGTIVSVFWYRDGPTGIFEFHVSTANISARTADCAKYRHVFFKDVGYRLITNPDKTQTPEANYEPLETILARIVNVTEVVLNNFASQDLFPWIDIPLSTTFFKGIIL